MSGVYNTPGYSAFGASVISDGVVRDVAPPDKPLALIFWITFDPNMRMNNGTFWFDFSLYEEGTNYGQSWVGNLRSIPGPFGSGLIWLWMGFNQATDATGGRRGFYNFKPGAIYAVRGVGGTQIGWSDFAIAEDDHYLYIE